MKNQKGFSYSRCNGGTGRKKMSKGKEGATNIFQVRSKKIKTSWAHVESRKIRAKVQMLLRDGELNSALGGQIRCYYYEFLLLQNLR